MKKIDLTAIILTMNEELHIERAIRSAQTVADRIIVVDSGSIDNTVTISQSLNAQVLTRPFTTQSNQFNWTLSQLPTNTDWILRLDADEIISRELSESIRLVLSSLGPDIKGASVHRRVSFMGRAIRWGGVYPQKTIRIFRSGMGKSNDRWMDERIVVDGKIIHLSGDLIDNNLKPLGWWTEKHNAYAAREVVEILDGKYHFLGRHHDNRPTPVQKPMNAIKHKIYNLLPIGTRALLYFTYRYLIRLGFLDGVEGRAFHFLQGFWYRYLVDMKLRQIETAIAVDSIDPIAAIEKFLGIKVVSQ